MRTRRAGTSFIALACMLAASGCILDELTQGSGPVPGGTVTITFGSATYTTPALTQATGEPLTIEGDTALVTFSVTAVSTATGTPYTLLAADGDSAVMGFTEISGNHLEVHANGAGCVATGGTLSLDVAADGTLEGTFAASGSSAGLDGGTSCLLIGSLTKVPIVR
jgi:hypothetical protein